jgi:hypothetical protein
MKQKLDVGSMIVIIVTFILFFTALFTKGFTHDLLLEAGIFLVSVKLIIMAYRNSVFSNELKKELHEVKTLIIHR